MTVPDDVATLPSVALAALWDPLTWQLSHGPLERRTARLGATVSTDTASAVLAAVFARAELAVLPAFLAAPQIAEGRLVQLLPDCSVPGGGIDAVFPA